MEIGTEAAQFPEKEYLNGIFVAMQPAILISGAGSSLELRNVGSGIEFYGITNT